MKVIFNTENVISGLQSAIAIMPPKTGAAFLRSLWIIAENDNVTFQSTDANIEFTGSYAAEVIEPGIVGVQGQVFYGLINNCIGKIELTFQDDSTTLNLKHANGEGMLPVVSQTWYQKMTQLPDTGSMVIKGDLLQTAISKVMFCIDENSGLDALTCLFIKPTGNEEGTINICGLDGHQFAMYSFANEEMSKNLPPEGLLIQKIYLAQINKWLNKDDIVIEYSDKRIFFKNVNNEILSVPRGLHQYPDYNNFLSKLSADTVSTVELQRRDLKGALSRIMTITTDVKHCTDFYISEDKHVIDCSAKSESSGEVSEKIAVSYNGNIRKISFNTKDLVQVIDHFSSKDMTMKLTTEDGPCGIEGSSDDSYIVVIMPIKTLETSYESEESV